MLSILVLRIAITLFLLILIPIYWKNYGVRNFLWLSDVGLFLTFFAVWFNSPLLISMAAIGILPLEIVWFIDFLLQSFKLPNLGITNYMFDRKYSRFLKNLSFFHIVTPIIWIWLLYIWGYDQRALLYQTGLMWLVFISSYFLTESQQNINWVFSPAKYHWKKISSFGWLMMILVLVPILILLPMHLLLIKLF